MNVPNISELKIFILIVTETNAHKFRSYFQMENVQLVKKELNLMRNKGHVLKRFRLMKFMRECVIRDNIDIPMKDVFNVLHMKFPKMMDRIVV